MVSQIPPLTACPASSGHDHFDSGNPLSLGGVQANALTCATCTAVNTGGRPQRSASPSEDTPGAAHQRCRHLRAVSSHTPSDAAIRTLGCPSEAASTMPARSARRCSVRPARANRSRSPRSVSVSTMRSGLVIGIVVILEHGSHQSHQPHPSQGLSWSTTRRSGTITPMAAPPASTKTSLQQRLSTRARERWPELAGVDVKFRGEFAYVTGRLKDGVTQPLMRLRYGGSAARWGFAIYLASKDGYQVSALPTGVFAGAPEDALDTACGLYLGDPTAWI